MPEHELILTAGVSKSARSWHVSYEQYGKQYKGLLVEHVGDRVSKILRFESDLGGVVVEFDERPGLAYPDLSAVDMWCGCASWARYDDKPVEKQIPCPHIVVCAVVKNLLPPNLRYAA